MIRDQVLDWLQNQVPQPRVQHILRVEQMAAELAQQHRLDPDKAAAAGLLHDLAKYFPPDQLLTMARAEGLTLTAIDQADPHLLHADVSAIVARDRFGVRDPEILAAVANHTLGQPEMDDLSCVVFLADSLEPGRGRTPELEELRAVSREDLHQALWRVCDRTLDHLIRSQRLIHPRMVLTRNWALTSAKARQAAQTQMATA